MQAPHGRLTPGPGEGAGIEGDAATVFCGD